MTVLTSNFSTASDLNVVRDILDAHAAAPLAYPSYCNVVQTNTGDITIGAVSSLTGTTNKPEGVEFTADDPVQRYSFTAQCVPNGLAFKVTREMMSDDRRRYVSRWAASLGRSSAETLNVDSAALLNNAFAAGVTYGDGVSLCNLSHPLVAGTEQNILTVAADLSPASLDEAMYTMGRTLDHRGKQLALRASKLIVPPELERVSVQILDSDLEYGTTDNQKNFFKNKGMRVLTLPHLTDTDAWFLQSDDHGLLAVFSDLPEFGSYPEESTQSLVYWVYHRHVFTAEDWRGVFGTPGAA